MAPSIPAATPAAGRLARLLALVPLALASCRTVPAGPPEDPGPRPPECPPDWVGWLGEYGERGPELLVYEADGRRLVRPVIPAVAAGDERCYGAPRECMPAGPGRYRVAAASGGEVELLRFEPLEGEEGGHALRLGGRALVRRIPAPEGAFRIDPLLPVAELREAAARAEPPATAADLPADLVDLRGIEGLRFDVRYASEENFLGVALYERPEAWAQRPVADALERAARRLAPRGFGLLVHDAFRPWRATRMFWDATPPALRDFVADPARGSRHNRGCAIDLTLYELESGEVVDMVSAFDEFTPRAAPDYPGGTSRQRWHRYLLAWALGAEGFTVYPNEWWHFDFEGWERYPVLADFPADLGGR